MPQRNKVDSRDTTNIKHTSVCKVSNAPRAQRGCLLLSLKGASKDILDSRDDTSIKEIRWIAEIPQNIKHASRVESRRDSLFLFLGVGIIFE